jgi:hypothetical protein
MESNERDSGRLRLQAAIAEQDRRGVQLNAAVGTPSELEANVRLRAADEQVAARAAWVRWDDDGGYPGAQRGPVRTPHPEQFRASDRDGRATS